jgi:HEAT repeats
MSLMSQQPPRSVLPPDAARQLTEFARTCKAAARAVSLYPAGHGAIAASLARLAETTARLTEDGPFDVQAHAGDLIVGEAHLPKSDAAVVELAALLHSHSIGGLTLNAGADAESWRTLLQLLARAPDDVRADGGIAHLWATAGGPSIDIREIDYAEVLREREGLAATIEQIVAAAIAGPRMELGDSGLRALLEIAGESSSMQQLLQQLELAAAQSPSGVEMQTAAFVRLLRALIEYVAHQTPEQLHSVLERMGRGARHLSPGLMASLLAVRSGAEATSGSVNVISALVENMSDASIAGFVAGSVVSDWGASERLVHAFRALAPEPDRQRQLLALAREDAEAQAPTQEGFPQLWERVEGMLTSYSDSRYVSEDYAGELTQARSRPVDVDRTNDDPPERIAAWLATVADAALRGLDRDLLDDLLTIEADPMRWRDIGDTVGSHADDLVRVGYFDQAAHLVEKLIEESRARPDRQPHGRTSLERFGQGSVMKHLPAYLREADDEMSGRWKDICHAIGPSVIAPLAESLAAERDARARRRMRDILVGFGPGGAEFVKPLMRAASWEIRRTAAFLLREFGGADGLRELVPLLTDTEPLVQREAVQGLVLNGSREASDILLKSLMAADGALRNTLMKEVLTLRDGRAAPLFAFVLRELEPRRLPGLYEAAIEVLATVGGGEAVAALEAALSRGPWWTPFANRKLRGAAARALKRIGSPAALDALRHASDTGSAGVRAAARGALGRSDR